MACNGPCCAPIPGTQVPVHAGILALLALPKLVHRWNAWLERSHTKEARVVNAEDTLAAPAAAHRPKHSAKYRALRQRAVSADGTRITTVRPRSVADLARGFGSVFAFLAAVDGAHALVLRGMGRQRDDVGRFFFLHAVTNAVVVLATWRDALRGLINPVENAVGPAKILVPYMISGLFAYHLTLFHNVPRAEWIHHILFGGGMGISGLLRNVGSLSSLSSFFIMGLPGGIDYAMLALVREGFLDASVEKRVNAMLNIWLRAPGLTLCSYLCAHVWRKSPVHVYTNLELAVTAALLFLNGNYYAGRVVANAATVAGFQI